MLCKSFIWHVWFGLIDKVVKMTINDMDTKISEEGMATHSSLIAWRIPMDSPEGE